MPKTATTFLQRKVFPKLKNIKYSKKHDFWKFRDVNAHADDQKYLYSWEFHENLEDALTEISSLYEYPKLIYCFRKHEDWVVSKYKYYIRKHGFKPFCEYIDLDSNKGVLDLEELNYSKKIELLKKQSNSNLLLFDYQELNDNLNLMVEQICTYTQTRIDSAVVNKKIKKSFSDKQLKYLLWLNRTYKYHNLQSNSKLLNRIYYRYREFLLHSFAFLVKILPNKIVNNIDLIDASIVEKIELRYSGDWENCKSEIEKSKTEYCEKT